MGGVGGQFERFSAQTGGNQNFDDLVKSPNRRHPGETRGPDIVPAEVGNHSRKPGFPFSRETLDSGFRRNDKFYGISTYYEFINLKSSSANSSHWMTFF